MAVTLEKATKFDCPIIHEMQIQSFAPLLEKYQDLETNPAAEPLERIAQRYAQPFTDYYFICVGEKQIGAMRICNFGDWCRLSPICILPEFQGHGYAQQAMILAESLYPRAKRWELDTILQEEKLCYLYEKMGYRKTGKYQHLKDGMDLVFYRKEM